ncbi:MAG: hypothetical protein LUC33_03590 [Prevotellaceae bacterium]|nr:hypothetical protein [Prevotellaceae bacterium]
MLVTIKNRVNYKMNARELAEFATERYNLDAVRDIAKCLKCHYISLSLKSLELMELADGNSTNYNEIKDLFGEIYKMQRGEDYQVKLEEEYPDVDFDCPTCEDEETYAPELWSEIKKSWAFPSDSDIDSHLRREIDVDKALEQIESVFKSFDTLYNRVVRVKGDDEDAARTTYTDWLHEESPLPDMLHEAIQPIVKAYRRERENVEFPKDAEDSFREAYICE